jgi:hypothetical protein
MLFHEDSMPPHRLTLALGFLLAFSAVPATAQQMDMDVMMRWGSADVIQYHIVGDYQAETTIASDGSGRADATDQVVIDLTWKLSEAKLVGTPTFQNAKSAVANLHDAEPSCLAPVLKGEYEHYELQGIKEGLAGALEFEVLTIYPDVEVAQDCTASRIAVPGSRKVRPEDFVIPSPVMMGMPLPDSDDLRVSPDKTFMTRKSGGWTWTFTPSIPAAQ